MRRREGRKALERYVGIWLPFVDAFEAGLWLFWVCEREIVAVPRPVLRVEDDRLHCADGPAVAWPGGARYWFWRGVQVPGKVIEEPTTLSTDEIWNEPNVEVRRVMMERFGYERLVRESGAEPIQEDDFGRLWRVGAPDNDDEPLVMVEVVNSTPEPDGSYKTYWLRVPPNIRTAHGGVAWSFGLAKRDYRVEIET